jgi:hypothetical protein
MGGLTIFRRLTDLMNSMGKGMAMPVSAREEKSSMLRNFGMRRIDRIRMLPSLNVSRPSSE